MLVVVQTYPAHFYQTLAGLNSIHRLGLADQLYLCIDDLSNLAWPSYLEDAKKIYQGLYDRILLLSHVNNMPRLRNYPWLRQQTNKLMLDTVIDDASWLFLDGDVILSDRPPDRGVPCKITTYRGRPLDQADPGPGEVSSQFLLYIRHMLGPEFDVFWHDKERTKIITATNPPVKHMSATVLSSMRSYIEERFGQTLIDVHFALAEDQRMAACEWDLIESYRQRILKEPSDWHFDVDFFATTYLCDRELGIQWFEDRDVNIDIDIWARLPEGKYL